jgi:glycerol-3-phosphate dehydrogenase
VRALDLGAEEHAHVVDWYGTEAEAILTAAAESGLVSRLDRSSPVLEAEILYAVQQGSARRLGDAVLRRTPLGATGNPGRAALERAAAIMGQALGWSVELQASEVASVLERYRT